MLVDAKTLIFTESDQNNLERVAALYADGIYDPIVIDSDNRILDGHNRARLAMAKGWDIPAVVLTNRDRLAAEVAGFDLMEICYAALWLAGEDDAAQSMDAQFRGSRLAERGKLAAELFA